MSNTTSTTSNTAPVADDIVLARPPKYEDKSPEQIAASEKAVPKLAKLFDEKQTVFARSRASYEAWLNGASFRMVAERISVITAQESFPDASPEDIARIAATPANKGGTKFVHTKLFTYAKAWQVIADSQLTPSIDNVRRAFTVCSTGGTAERLDQLVKVVQSLNDEERESAFMSGARMILDGKAKQDSEGRPNSGASASDPATVIAKAEMTLELATAAFVAVGAHNWTTDEKATLLDLIAELSANVLTDSEPVEA